MKSDTCILLFSRSSAAESRHKSILEDTHANSQLHDVLYKRTHKLLNKSGLPIVKIDENQQVGNSFGEKFFHAISTVFKKGYDKVIAVGTDCPSLKGGDIKFAYEELQLGRACLGPAKDGGIYLLAISAKMFRESFKELPWETETLLERLSDFLIAEDAVVSYLATKIDLDSRIQFNTIARFLIKQLGFDLLPLEPTSNIENVLLPCLDEAVCISLSRRGPPMFSKAA